MKFNKYSGIYSLQVKQNLSQSVEDAWSFFSDPGNLQLITPSKMGFRITSAIEMNMYEGQIITYKVGIFPFIKSNWVTEITQVKVNEYFIDEQRIGPYKMWHHEHHFRKTANGTEMTDKVIFALPYGILGHFAFHLFVKRQLKNIFEYRKKVIDAKSTTEKLI